MDLVEFEVILNQNDIDRFNAKVLLCNGYDGVHKIKEAFLKSNYQVRDLREFQTTENMWFGVSRLSKIINNLTQNTVLFSISEIVRFYNKDDFKIFFDNLFAIEKKNFTVCIPLFGLKSRFTNEYFNTFYRKDEYEFVYEIDTQGVVIDLNIVDFDVPYDNRLDTIKDWLNFYNAPQNNIICSPRPLVERIQNRSSDDLINVKHISNQKEFIQKYMKKDFLLDYKESEKSFWNKLIVDLKDNDLKKILQEKLNLYDLNPSEILKKICQEKDLYTKWLLRGYSLEYSDKDSYFYKIVQSSSIEESLINKVWFDIFDEFRVDHSKERFEILCEFYKNEIPSKTIGEKLKDYLQNCESVLSILTGITKAEKELIIKYYSDEKVDQKYLEKYYPDLLFYLSDVDFENTIEWIGEYFDEYKNSKVTNHMSSRLESLLDEKNSSKESFFEWYSDVTFKDAYEFLNSNQSNHLWIDGLGIEWLGIIKNRAEEKGYKCEFYLSKSKLPTTTKCNKFDNIEKVDDLDNYIHKQASYKYPANLIDEIDIVKTIIDEYLNDELVIVSDHGFSAFCSFKPKTNTFSDDEHEGRCAKIKEIIEDNNYFSYDFECGRYLVALNHNSLNHKTKREAHGGATPEEVIVPIVKIYKQTKEKDNTAIIKPEITKKGFEEEDLF